MYNFGRGLGLLWYGGCRIGGDGMGKGFLDNRNSMCRVWEGGIYELWRGNIDLFILI